MKTLCVLATLVLLGGAFGQTKPSDKPLLDSSGVTFSTSGVLSTIVGCDEGTTVQIPVRGGGYDTIAKCHNNYFERVPPAPAAQPAQKPAKPTSSSPSHGGAGIGAGAKNTAQSSAKADADAPLPYDSVDCDNAHGDPSKCTVEADEPAAQKGVMPTESKSSDTGRGAPSAHNVTSADSSPAPSLSCAPECKFRVVTKTDASQCKTAQEKKCAKEAGWDICDECSPTNNGAFCQGPMQPIPLPRCATSRHSLYLGNQKIGTLEEK